MRRYLWGIVNLCIAVFVAVAGYIVIAHPQDLADWWTLQSFKPSSAVTKLADDTTMIGRGRDLFFASRPEVNTKAVFNRNCSDQGGEKSLVLGCYKLKNIYIYNVTDKRLAGVKQVTAAHEMLHAAYERLSFTDRNNVNTLLEKQIAATKDRRLQELIDLYEEQEPGEKLNEMHSILGTEYKNLLPELESYYKKYFSDRSKVVDYAANYQRIFIASQDRIAAFDEELAVLKKQIDADHADLDARKSDIDQRSARLASLRQSNPEQYNREVPGFNARVQEYNSRVASAQEIISSYNAIVAKRNNEAAGQNALYRSLDSNYKAVPAS